MSALGNVCALGLGLLGLLLSSCQSDVGSRIALVGLSNSCRINSDCSSLLICVFERCHQACETSRDCTTDARCVETEQLKNVCQLPDEAACSKGGVCPGSEVCGADSECRDACSSDGDCVRGQTCAGGTCADASELDADGRLPASPDRPVSAVKPCVFDSDCPADLKCLDSECRSECQAQSDCASGKLCEKGLCVAEAEPDLACRLSSDCPADQACVDGTCITPSEPPTPECEYDSDCAAPGQHCRSGSCQCECATNADCVQGSSCQDACACVPSRVIIGNVHITNDRQLAAFADVIEVKGQLTLELPSYGTFHLPTLRKVGTLLALDGKASVVLDSLEEVTTAFACYERCAAPALKRVGTLSWNSSIEQELNLPLLETAGDMSIWYGSRLTAVRLPQLTRAKLLRVEGNSKLASFEAPKLESLDALTMGMNDVIERLELPLASIGGIAMSANPKLQTLSLPAVTTLTGALSIAQEPLLTSLDLSGVTTALSFELRQLPLLTAVALPRLKTVSNALLLTQTGLTSLDLPQLESAGSINVSSNHDLPVCALSTLQQAMTDKNWAGTITQTDNLECVCNGAVCQ